MGRATGKWSQERKRKKRVVGMWEKRTGEGARPLERKGLERDLQALFKELSRAVQILPLTDLGPDLCSPFPATWTLPFRQPHTPIHPSSVPPFLPCRPFHPKLRTYPSAVQNFPSMQTLLSRSFFRANSFMQNRPSGEIVCQPCPAAACALARSQTAPGFVTSRTKVTTLSFCRTMRLRMVPSLVHFRSPPKQNRPTTNDVITDNHSLFLPSNKQTTSP
jgi:hypothetical protein